MAREITVISKSDSGPPSLLDKVERWCKLAATIALPLLLVVVGCMVDSTLQNQTVSQKYVELATTILQTPIDPKHDLETQGKIRKWAVGLLVHSSPIALPAGLADSFVSGTSLPTGSFGPVTGEDDRYLIKEIDAQPYASICHIRVIPGRDNPNRNRREFFGTGFLVHPNLVLTSGYHVYSHDKSKDAFGYAEQIEIFIGYSKSQYQGGRGQFRERILVSNRDHFRVPQEWIKGDMSYNLGAIIIHPEQTESRRFLPIQTLHDAELSSGVFRISSYPRDREFPEIWESTGRLTLVRKERLLYSIDTGDASSGAPIWLRGSEGPAAIGIHIASGEVRGIRFTEQNRALIDQWIKDASSLQTKTP